MLSRTALRAVVPLRQTTLQSQPLRRTFASGPPSHMGTNAGMFTYMLGGGALAGVGYWYYASGGKPVIPVGNASKQKAESQGTAPHTSFVDKGQKASGEKTFKGGEQGFIDLKLEAVENVNHNTKRLRFALPDGDVSGLEVASAILTSYKGPEASKPTIRPYTPISDEDSVGYLDLLVKKYPEGPMSTHLHDMEPGHRLNFKGPIPKYPLKENQHKHIALIAGGTGITPMYQLCRAVFNNPNDKTQVTLVFGNVSEEDILLKREFEELENKYPRRFRAFYVLNNPPEGYQGGKGMIDKTLLKTVLPEPKEENVKVFVCGPPGLYKAISGTKKSVKDQGEVEGILKELGYSKEQVYKF